MKRWLILSEKDFTGNKLSSKLATTRSAPKAVVRGTLISLSVSGVLRHSPPVLENQKLKLGGRIFLSFLFSASGIWKFYQISSLLVFFLEIFMTQRFFFFEEDSVPSDQNQTNLLSGALFSCRSLGRPVPPFASGLSSVPESLPFISLRLYLSYQKTIPYIWLILTTQYRTFIENWLMLT